ncbi:conjugative transfer ATPase [Citrobacter sp. S2-9]|uniref:Conjugative transfer ATPase n=1 Tax=Citrobacter enshiensis TaxID=2971264 RepID=A0ABT8PVM1_9ENTR|nr:conjugative transfer ATPase [Citrobacter enshiensis]MDN8600309.1 conjugative transfer ATPase [Citrobacter enshiensis]
MVISPARSRSGKLTEQAVNAAYHKGPSFADLLPWVEFQGDSQTLLLDDGRSVAAVYDITSVGTEGRSPQYLADIRDIVKDALQDSFDELDNHPWVVQFFSQAEDDLSRYMQRLRDYVTPAARGSDFSEAWLGEMARHLNGITRTGGLFVDDRVTKAPWRGQIQRTRMVVYRYLPAKAAHGDLTAEMALNNTCGRLVSALAGAGLTTQRLDETAVRDWLTRWLNPAPDCDDRRVFYRTVTQPDTPDSDTPPVLTDFAESLLFHEPRSDTAHGVWWLDGRPHRAVVVDRLRRAPAPGHLTGEQRRGDALNALTDLLPELVIMAMTIVIYPQDLLEAHLNRLSDRSIGENIDSEYTKKDCRDVRQHLKAGHKMYRSTLAFYLSAEDIPALNRQTRELNSVLLNAGLVPVQDADDPAPLAAWLRWLPCCFDPARDKRHLYTRFNFVQHIANLLPVFGRETGTGHPGISYFNRGGAPLDFDPLNKLDRATNGHLLLLGPTGAGKSATLNGKIVQLMALHRPRLFIVEAGNSFGLTADYARRHGLTVNKISLKPGSGITLPLFADAHRLVAQAASADIPDDEDRQEQQEGDDPRDILGEMEITARLMITGGEAKEDARLTRPDRAMIRQAIINAATGSSNEKRQTLTQDVRDALFALAQAPTLPENRRSRAYEMAESMNMFCTGFEGELFNREGRPWPDADITLVDLATFAREGYEAQLAIAYISLINHINNIGERDQHLSRPVVNITDESHIITVNPLLARFLTKGSKMWRKLGIWLWLATQNLSDFPDDAKKLLNMIEWWELLVMPPEEVGQLKRFKTLTPEQEQLLLSASKSPGKYTEGVVLAAKIEALFRVVPPGLYLALGMTEKHEKAERAQLMKEQGISELDAAIQVAREMDKKRGLS